MADEVAEGGGASGSTVDERVLFAPLNALSGRIRWAVLLTAVAVTLGWSAWLNGNLLVAWGLPDVAFYLHMADGRLDLVPQPFSARPLAPLLARWISGALHCWTPGGFAVLAYVSLAWSAGVVYWLALKTQAPRWMLPALVSVPFWPQLLGDAGLPDPLYTALLACLLVALEQEWMAAAAVLMLPLMLARESTSLVLVCLLAAGWRRLRWRGSALGVGCAVLGAMVVHRWSAGGLPNPERMSGGLYLAGKVVANFLRSVGVVPWSNVYPELCRTPVWQMGMRVGPVRSVGVCTWAATSPLQATRALLTTFGALPALCLAGWKGWGVLWKRDHVMSRFCLLYGGVSFLIAPALGTWYARLFGYGWPLLLVAVPRLIPELRRGFSGKEGGAFRSAAAGALVVLHLVVCGLGSGSMRMPALVCSGLLDATVIALVLVHWREGERGPVEG